MHRPLMIVVAGPPGSGKTAAFPTGSFGVDGFNIDDRCAQIVGSYRALSVRFVGQLRLSASALFTSTSTPGARSRSRQLFAP